jgi:hypothetical protein
MRRPPQALFDTPPRPDNTMDLHALKHGQILQQANNDRARPHVDCAASACGLCYVCDTAQQRQHPGATCPCLSGTSVLLDFVFDPGLLVWHSLLLTGLLLGTTVVSCGSRGRNHRLGRRPASRLMLGFDRTGLLALFERDTAEDRAHRHTLRIHLGRDWHARNRELRLWAVEVARLGLSAEAREDERARAVRPRLSQNLKDGPDWHH